MLLTAASSPRRLPRKSWEHDILIYIEWTGLQGYSSNRLKNKIKQVPLVWVSKMMQNESNSAGLEKQSPLEIHRLSPNIFSEKSASSVQRKLGSVKFAILSGFSSGNSYQDWIPILGILGGELAQEPVYSCS